jgi:hypothetical protein
MGKVTPFGRIAVLILNCGLGGESIMNGYEKLKAAVERDCKEGQGCFNPNGCDKKNGGIVYPGPKGCFHSYCNQFKWIIDRAKHYAEKTGLPWEEILNSWEADRSYWYMNYYQDGNQPEIKGDKVKVFETVDSMINSLGERKFRCPSCGGISSSPYKCDTGLEMSKGKVCDWNVHGLFRDLGKGVYVYCKDKIRGETIFMPISWEG